MLRLVTISIFVFLIIGCSKEKESIPMPLKAGMSVKECKKILGLGDEAKLSHAKIAKADDSTMSDFYKTEAHYLLRDERRQIMLGFNYYKRLVDVVRFDGSPCYFLSVSNNVTDIGIRSLSSLKGLKKLSLDRCKKLTNNGIGELKKELLLTEIIGSAER